MNREKDEKRLHPAQTYNRPFRYKHSNEHRLTYKDPFLQSVLYHKYNIPHPVELHPLEAPFLSSRASTRSL